MNAAFVDELEKIAMAKFLTKTALKLPGKKIPKPKVPAVPKVRVQTKGFFNPMKPKPPDGLIRGPINTPPPPTS